MIPKEKIEQAAEQTNTYSGDSKLTYGYRKGFTAGVSFAETELKQIALELIHYCRYEPFEVTSVLTDAELFDKFMAERTNP